MRNVCRGGYQPPATIKRILGLVLALSMLLSCVPIIASAETSGTCGTQEDNVTWTLDDEGTLTISGEGDMKDYFPGEFPFFEDTSIINVKIETGVTSIGNYAFSGCSGLTSITIPDSVTSIGNYAFEFCDNLTNITIPDSVKSIGFEAFIDTGYYNNTENWENGVLYIGNHLIDANYDEIDTEYTIKSETKTIADYAFEFCGSLTEITIPDSVAFIGEGAFGHCCSLTKITIPDNVTRIGDWAFFDCCSLTGITIGSSVTSIGDYAFVICESLTDVYFSGTETQWNAISIGLDNDYLTNATIHYNYDKPLQPTTTVEIDRTDTETDTSYTFEVDAAEQYENCYVYAAVYDASGALLGINRVPLETEENTTITVDKSQNDALAKVFIWADTLQPIISSPKEFSLI